MDFSRYALALGALVCALPACSSDSMNSTESLGGKNTSPLASDNQTPPNTNGTEVEAWLAAGSYKSWACDTDAHPAIIKASPHGVNRICSNDLAANFAGVAGTERPVGTAGVKELYNDSMALVGYAVYVKTKATSGGGSNWYWYERVPLDSAVPHNAQGVVADGLGSDGTASSICVSCHTAAASDSAHTVPSSNSGDFVYDQVSSK